MDKQTEQGIQCTAERAEERNGQQLVNGFKAVVRRGDSTVIYDSHSRFGTRGILPTKRNAEDHGRRWVAAEHKRQIQIAELKQLREHELPGLLDETITTVDALKKQRTDIAADIKKIEERRTALIRAAHHPNVQLDFDLDSGDFSISIVDLLSDSAPRPAADEGSSEDA